jgi:putative spermidine/putrescine transport system permease protein
MAAGGVLAQFGGVMLAFAFFATFGFNGFVTTLALKFSESNFLASPDWLYGLFGLGVVYTFFQIPLMFIVFLPAVENLKPQWREASESLGGSSQDYWFRIGLPVLAPSFLGGILLLFVNAFSAYATAAALISQGTIITPLDIGSALSSETGGASAPLAKTLSLYMIAVVTVVMVLYSWLRKRVSKWEQIK